MVIVKVESSDARPLGAGTVVIVPLYAKEYAADT